MKKSIFRKNVLKEASVLLIAVFIVLSTVVVTGKSATDWIKYNDESTENGLGLTSGGIITEAIELTSDKLTGYRDYVISEIKVSIGCDAYGAEPGVPYEVWIQNSLPSDPTNANVVASGVSSSSVWNLISVIKTPIPDSGSVFIGVNLDHDAGQYPCGID